MLLDTLARSKRGPLERERVTRTLEGLRLLPKPRGRRAVEWNGWRSHDGWLAPPMDGGIVRALEADLGPLPDEYRSFLLTVGAWGAGPGFGLVRPTAPTHKRYAAGAMGWIDGESSEAEPRGVLPLAHAGCGVVWVLVLEGEHRGEVWVDAAGSDGNARRVAGTFDEWYRSWLESAVRDESPWCQWDRSGCSTPRAISELLRSLESKGMTDAETRAELAGCTMASASIGDRYFDHGAILDPCHSCVLLAARFGMGERAFARGLQPHFAAATSYPSERRRTASHTSDARPAWWRRMWNSLRGS